jgi:hypothetical protein
MFVRCVQFVTVFCLSCHQIIFVYICLLGFAIAELYLDYLEQQQRQLVLWLCLSCLLTYSSIRDE